MENFAYILLMISLAINVFLIFQVIKIKKSLRNEKHFKNKKILFVEDDEILRKLYSIKFKKAGWDIFALPDAQGDFVKNVADIKPDLISLDVMMPGRNGFEALELLRKDERTKNISVFFLTNLGQKEDMDKAKELGSDGYIVKAEYTPAEVLKIYSDFLEKYKL